MKICGVDECDQPHVAKGLCSKHYQRWRKYGSTDDPWPSLEERLLARTVKEPGGCWVWTGKRAGSDDAYGVISRDGQFCYVHRAAHELWIGPIPRGFQVDHVASRGCRSTLCVNPAHLEAVTPQENVARSSGLATVNSNKTHCVNGHKFTPENTRLSHEGHRRCRTCAQAVEDRKVGNPEWKAYEAAYRRELRRKRREAREESA